MEGSRLENEFAHMVLPLTTVTSGRESEAAADIWCLPVQIVNVCFIAEIDRAGGWLLVDAGMPRSADMIIREAEDLFGSRAPEAIILTHGHFDHVGAIIDLIDHWQAPVYAHEKELPYLTGQNHYPPADPQVDGGLISEMSPLFPNEGIDLGQHVKGLPADGHVPGAADWRWLHTPGHTPGHISLFRERDRALIAGDAFVTVKQESLYKVITQQVEISGPPKYFTTDWQAAKRSVQKLASLEPTAAVTGHGRPMLGSELRDNLHRLAQDFDQIAVPEEGRYVHEH